MFLLPSPFLEDGQLMFRRCIISMSLIATILVLLCCQPFAAAQDYEGAGYPPTFNAGSDTLRQARSTADCPSDVNSAAAIESLQKAATGGNLVKVRHLIHDCGVNVDAVGPRGSTALHEAAFIGDPHVVSFLIQSGANPNKRKTDGWGAIHLAVDGHNPIPALKALLDGGANIGLKAAPPMEPNRQVQRFRGTGMELAADTGKQDVVAFLKDYKKPPAQSNPVDTAGDGLTCLEKAMKKVKVEELHQVLQAERTFTELLRFLRGLLRECNLDELDPTLL